jgi:anaerobic selenocysteine-containing dehydrogenase
MDDLSRRDFLKRGSIGVAAGAVAISSGAAIGNAVAANAKEHTTEGGAAEQTDEPIVAYVQRGAHGEVHLMVGEQEIVHRDKNLARQIIRAARP